MLQNKHFLFILLLILAYTIYGYTSSLDPTPFDNIDHILQNAISSVSFPGCVAVVGNKKGILYQKAFGHFTYGIPPPESSNNPEMKLDTIFDMASISKILGVTTAVAQFYERGELNLDWKLSDERLLGKAYANHGKDSITVRHCMLHNAGFPPDPIPSYFSVAFGCSESRKYYPVESFSCQETIYYSVLNQTLASGIGEKYVYSDLSMITLMYAVGKLAMQLKYISESELLPGCLMYRTAIAQCYFEAYVRKYVVQALKLTDSGFLIPREKYVRTAPCTNDTYYRHRVDQGKVSDENAYSMGGIAGHAGFFSTAIDLIKYVQAVMFQQYPLFNKTTSDYFATEYNHTQSSRAIGWNTNDPYVFDYGWDLSCGNFSARTYTHTGFTGTQICCDPTRDVFTILLTNRVYPDPANIKIRQVRKDFNTAVQKIVDAYYTN